MARMKSAKDVTIEGVGTDAAMDGWGIHFMSETSTTAAGLGLSLIHILDEIKIICCYMTCISVF